MNILQSHPQLKSLGITKPNRIYWQLNTDLSPVDRS